jgi:transcription-repair coupling factor (superfamily II helicase)
MELSGLLDILRATPPYRELMACLQQGKTPGDLGVIRAARPFVLAALARDWPGPVIYLTARVDRAYNVSEQLPVWIDGKRVQRFAEPTPMFYERAPWGESVTRSRLAVLAALAPPDDFATTDSSPIVVTSARAIMQRTLPVNQFRQGSMVLETGQRHHIQRLLERWLKLGYEPTTIVVEPGQFSRRGGVVDIYPAHADSPVRIEFFDDEIDSLRSFDPSTQRSAAQLKRVVVTPAREALPEHAPPTAQHLGQWFAALPPQEADATSPASDAASLENGTAFPYLEFYLPYLYPHPVSLLDYAPDNALIVIEDWSELRDCIAEIEEHAIRSREEKQEANEIPPDYPLPYITWDALVEDLESRTTVRLASMTPGDENGESENGHTTSGFRRLFAPEQHFGGQLKPLLQHVRGLRKADGRVVIVTEQAARLADLWREQESFTPMAADITVPPTPRSVVFVRGALREGWRLRSDDGDTHLFTDAEIFGWHRPEPRRRKAAQRARLPEASYADLQPGDFVVHVDYGIGRFGGLRRRTLEELEREYLVIEYAGTDMVFVPIHQADRITRYIGPDDRPPTITKLGKPDWTRVKTQAQKAVEEEARGLLELYAARASVTRPSFGPDSPWQHELEAGFPYVETEDQLRAVREVKADMERSFPMDRLICGDVGYGKTEVALRAAFKAVMDGRQVALLVPTTVLAQQHFETFTQRLAPFPVVVEMLSRFRSKEEQNSILPSIASGEIDILIGTHRILQDDVMFKNLGLVIIDEEQRFGVTHKEHFKRLRTQVDVLTLTATPIPRTMYMALTGVRDISMIQTPPEERMPVITHVGPFDEGLVRQAIMRELERGGQVFYVHNRVRTIDRAREHLEEIVPEARTVLGHGQMDERTLERVMIEFAHGEYDILVSTSIIESGIDIPNANTLIVDRADWFGLAQLYQLRGRVGRSAQQAYAYFFHPSNNRITEEARARLETLEENTELGSGFQIAMRDLELRGAGGILSTKQSGHVAAVGLHLYTQLLAQAVQQLKGEKQPEAAPLVNNNGILIDLPLPAYLPNDWIPEMTLRLQLYRRVGNLTSNADVDAMRDELRDRFGPLPPAVEGLLYQIDVKLLAQQAGATGVINLNNIINIKLPYLPEVNRERLQEALGDDVRVSRTAILLPISDEHWQLRLLDILRQLGRGVQEGIGL